MLKRWLWLLIPLAAAGAVISWWGVFHLKPEPPRGLVVLETEREIANLPHYAAAGLGYFRQAGLQVTLGTAPRGALTKEDTARADLILTPLDRILDGGARAVAGLTHTEPALLLARERSGPFAWDQISGRTVIGEHPEGTGEIALERILRGHEMIPQSQYVCIQHLPPHLRLGTYLSGTGEYIILCDPEAARMQKYGHGHIVSDLTSAGRMPARVAAAPAAKIKSQRENLRRYTEALARAQVWIAQHSAAEVTAVAAPWFPYLDYKTLTGVVTRAKEADLWPADPRIEQATYDHFMELLVEAGELPAPVPYAEVVAPI